MALIKGLRACFLARIKTLALLVYANVPSARLVWLARNASWSSWFIAIA